MNYQLGEHNPPHIHGVLDNKRCSIDLNGNILEKGNISKINLNKVIKFVIDHKEELYKMWQDQIFIKF